MSEGLVYAGERAAGGAIDVEDELEVREVLNRVYSAWAENDAEAFVAPYAPTATALLPGIWLHDREEIHATMAAMFAGELKGSEGRHEIEQIRLLRGDGAVVISQGAVRFAGQAEPADETRALDS